MNCRLFCAKSWLLGDTDTVLRLFVNLIGNAIKYTRQGGVAVIAVGNAKATKVFVIDTGVGIPKNHLPRIFERFYRADASRHDEGSGLGLAFAMDIARAHGGTIEVNSHVSKGSTFVVTLLRG